MRLRTVILLAAVIPWTATGQTYTISTFAGGGLPINIPGTAASLGSPAANTPQNIAADRAGNVFFPYQNAVLRLDATTRGRLGALHDAVASGHLYESSLNANG